jgi:hypothetical protein
MDGVVTLAVEVVRVRGTVLICALVNRVEPDAFAFRRHTVVEVLAELSQSATGDRMT